MFDQLFVRIRAPRVFIFRAWAGQMLVKLGFWLMGAEVRPFDIGSGDKIAEET